MKKAIAMILFVCMLFTSIISVQATEIEVPDGYGNEYSTPENPFTFIYDTGEEYRPGLSTRYGVLKYGYVKGSQDVLVYSTASKTTSTGFVGPRERVFVLRIAGTDSSMYYIEYLNVNTVDRGYVDSSAIKVPGYSWERPITTGRISQDYGVNSHAGIDVAAAAGTDVYAVSNVTHQSKISTGTCQGTTVLINYGNHITCKVGNYTVVYAHLSSFAEGTASNLDSYRGEYSGAGKVTKTVATWTPDAGDVIGGVGNTGWSTGNHLHFEIHSSSNSNTKYDPFNFIVFPDIGY